ncbi:hypothetical protein V8C86DRAFT_2980527 [Haematococcus lacustris]
MSIVAATDVVLFLRWLLCHHYQVVLLLAPLNGAHITGGALDAPSPPTAPAQATTSTFTTSQSCHSLLDNVVVPR